MTRVLAGSTPSCTTSFLQAVADRNDPDRSIECGAHLPTDETTRDELLSEAGTVMNNGIESPRHLHAACALRVAKMRIDGVDRRTRCRRSDAGPAIERSSHFGIE